MKRVTGEFTIVIVGSWNTRIFTPPWVSEHLLGDPSMQVQIILDGPYPRLRFMTTNVNLHVLDDRLIIGVRKCDDPSFEAAELLATKVVKTLPYTPLIASGVNCGYSGEEIPPILENLFRFPDTLLLDSAGLRLGTSKVIRALNTDLGTCNLKHEFDGPKTRVHFNFHRPYNPKNSPELFTDRLRLAQKLAENVLGSVYKIDIEDQEDATIGAETVGE